MSIKSVMPSNHVILCRPLVLLPSIFPSIRVFSNESVICLSGQSVRDSASASVLPMNIQDWFPLELTGLISLRMDGFDLLAIQGTLQESSPTPQFKSINSLALNFLYGPTLTSIHDYWKNHSLIRWTFVSKVMSLLFNMLSRLVIVFLVRSKSPLISWLQSPSAVILEPKKIKCINVSTLSPSIYHEVMGLDAMIFVFWILNFKPAFSFSTFTFIKRLSSSSLLSAIRVVSSAYLRLLIFLPAVLIPPCASTSPVFHMMYSVYKLNKQGNNIYLLLLKFGTSPLFQVWF